MLLRDNKLPEIMRCLKLFLFSFEIHTEEKNRSCNLEYFRFFREIPFRHATARAPNLNIFPRAFMYSLLYGYPQSTRARSVGRPL